MTGDARNQYNHSQHGPNGRLTCGCHTHEEDNGECQNPQHKHECMAKKPHPREQPMTFTAATSF